MPLSEFLAAGPARREQLTADVYETYRKFGYNPETDTPEFVQQQLTTRPAKAWRVVVWYGNIAPLARDSTTLSDGAVFRDEQQASRFARSVIATGGKFSHATVIDAPKMWYETVEHFARLGRMTVAELGELKAHWDNLTRNPIAPKPRIDVRVELANGNHWTTGIRASFEEAKAYYFVANANGGFGQSDETLSKVVSVTLVE